MFQKTLQGRKTEIVIKFNIAQTYAKQKVSRVSGHYAKQKTPTDHNY